MSYHTIINERYIINGVIADKMPFVCLIINRSEGLLNAPTTQLSGYLS